MDPKRFKMKPVELKHLEQYNQLLRYVFQVTENELQQIGWEEKEIIRAKSPALKQADVWGWFDGDNLISQVAVYPMKVNIFGQIYDMGGLTGVGTYPEYSNQGLMHHLLYHALTKMRERKQYISYLYPYSIPYYRRKGWEIISDMMTFEIKDDQLPKIRPVPGEIRRTPTDSQQVKDAYQRFANKRHGALLRDALAWNEYWLWDSDDFMAAIYYNEAEEPDGYLIYWIADEIFHIKDMIFLNETARIGLWNFVSAHFSMISKVVGNTYTNDPLAFWLEDSDIKETIAPYYMARIVDFTQFMGQYRFKPTPAAWQWTFSLKDPLLRWNQGAFTLAVTPEGRAAVTPAAHSDDQIDIQTMTTMLLGYKRPSYLKQINRLQCGTQTIEQLERAILQQAPYFSDYF